MAKTDIVRNEPATSAEQQADVAQKERTPLKFNKVNIRSLRTGLRAGRFAADTSNCGARGCGGSG